MSKTGRECRMDDSRFLLNCSMSFDLRISCAPAKSCASWLCSTSGSGTPRHASSHYDPSQLLARTRSYLLLTLQLGELVAP